MLLTGNREAAQELAGRAKEHAQLAKEARQKANQAAFDSCNMTVTNRFKARSLGGGMPVTCAPGANSTLKHCSGCWQELCLMGILAVLTLLSCLDRVSHLSRKAAGSGPCALLLHKFLAVTG